MLYVLNFLREQLVTESLDLELFSDLLYTRVIELILTSRFALGSLFVLSANSFSMP